jgi:hypothetical protein
MATEPSLGRYRKWYGKLLRLYPKSYRERFGEGMEQTFHDLCRERAKGDGRIFGFALGMFLETSVGILRENVTINIMRNRNIVRLALIVASILLVPLVGGANWDLFDYVVAGALLFGTGLAYELVAKRMSNKAYRCGVGLAVGAALVLTWMNLAVGLIGSENNPANLMYFGVLAIGVVGALLARFRPEGMARALFAMALAQLLVPVIAVIIWQPNFSRGVVGVFALNGFFVLMFVLSALLFQRASAVAAKNPTA